MKILGIIPARGGSKGIPGKNIKLLGKKPLMQYTTELALSTSLLSKVMLTSDDNDIIAVGKSLGIEVPFKRPTNLAEDNTPTLPVIQHALAHYKEQGEEFDAVCLLQLTSPFRTVDFIESAIKRFVESKADSLISVQKVPHEYNPHWTFEADKEDLLKIATGEDVIITRRQELPDAFHRDGMIYLTKTEVILESNSLYGKSIAYIESPATHYMNLDTMEDWKRAEELLTILKL